MRADNAPEESRRQRAGGILGPVVEIGWLDISVALRTEEFHGQRTSDDICTAALSFTW
jgi:hypothetical protein